MTEKNFNMNSFHHSIYLNKPVSEVYKYAATPDGFTKWFIGESEFNSRSGKRRGKDEIVSAGDNYSFRWLAKDLSVTGEVLRVTDNSSIRFTFGLSFIVDINVIEANGRTLLTLAQEYSKSAEPNDFAHINCCVCWAFFVTNLKSVIEYGNDLRETHAESEELVNR
jgi:hypothetical protein